MGRKLIYILVAAFTLLTFGAGAQTTVQSLQEQIRQAEEEIRRSNELLQKTKKDKELNQTELKLVQSRIRSRREVVTSLEKQIALLEAEISSREGTVGAMSAELEHLKEEYAAMVREAYRNYRLNNFALFLFAADDFKDATRRINYMRRYNRAREAKAARLMALAQDIGNEIEELNGQREELDGTKQSHSQELTTLSRDESQYRSSVNQLSQQESRIAGEVRAKQQQIDKAQQEIQRLIAEEARRNQAEQHTEAQDRYITELSGWFDENRGKLPYPVRGGVITDRYGTHPHPTQRGLTVNNKGINIAGERGSAVNCVFEGTVSKVFALPGYNNCVMVRHGDYITLYANLASVAVRAGDNIGLNQRVGGLADSGNPDDVYLHFEIWKETTNLNPEQWLGR